MNREKRIKKNMRQMTFAIFGMLTALVLAAAAFLFMLYGDTGPSLLLWLAAIAVGLPFKRYAGNVRKRAIQDHEKLHKI